MSTPAPPGKEPTVLTRDPVRLVWVAYGFIQAVVIVLVGAELIPHQVSAVVTGVALACYVAVSELFVRKETVPLEPLLQQYTLVERSDDALGRDFDGRGNSPS